jgi:hypothetical protein
VSFPIEPTCLYGKYIFTLSFPVGPTLLLEIIFSLYYYSVEPTSLLGSSNSSEASLICSMVSL